MMSPEQSTCQSTAPLHLTPTRLEPQHVNSPSPRWYLRARENPYMHSTSTRRKETKPLPFYLVTGLLREMAMCPRMVPIEWLRKYMGLGESVMGMMILE